MSCRSWALTPAGGDMARAVVVFMSVPGAKGGVVERNQATEVR